MSESIFPAVLLVRLWQLGGIWTGKVDVCGFGEILTPLGVFDKYVWTTAHGLATMLAEWEADPRIGGPRLALVFGVAAGTIQAPEGIDLKL